MKRSKITCSSCFSHCFGHAGCASRKPAADIQAGQNPLSAHTTVNTTGLSEDAALNAQNLAGASSKGVTEANKAYLAKARLFTSDYDSSELSNEDLQTLQAPCTVPCSEC